MLGASSWRIEEITHDRVLVSPAPGQPGRMPFWKADTPGRPLELGRHIGALVRSLRQMPPAAAVARLTTHHDLDARAAENLMRYLADQAAATGSVPDDRTIVIERMRDELGDWRICVLSPFGGRIHAPWAMAVVERVKSETGVDAETMWTDDGFVVRFPETEAPPDPALMIPASDEAEALVVRQLGGTALFAAKFREAAARALLLPRRRPGGRTPLWQQRKRAADLLAVAAKFGSFPMVLEAYREVLRDVFDMPALIETLRNVERRDIRTVTVDSTMPSPFASALLFGYVANYIYDGDAPLAERRAQALAVDQSQLRELLGDAELRELLDAESMDAIERQLQRLDPQYHVKSADGVHDMLLSLGDLTEAEIQERSLTAEVAASVGALVTARRVLAVRIAGEPRVIAVEDAARFRDALGVPLPMGIPESLLQPVRDPLGDLALRYARTHAPFTAPDFAARYGLGVAAGETVLMRLAAEERLVEGEFRPGGTRREWTDAGVLRMLRRRSLAKLRHEIEPVDQAVLGRFATTWQGIVKRRSGADALLDAIEQLQGAPLPASILETEILPARIDIYDPADLDAVTAAGEVVWVGVEPLGERDGRLALYLADHLPRLLPPTGRPTSTVRLKPDPEFSERETKILDVLRDRGASFFGPLLDAAGGGYPAETVDALWNLAWQGLITNDTFHALRAFTRARAPRRRMKGRQPTVTAFRSRRLAPPSAEGRWTLVPRADHGISATGKKAEEASGRGKVRTTSAGVVQAETTKWAAAVTQQLLARHGVVTREAVAADEVTGGFGIVYPVLKGLEENGRIRRGYFVAGLGATQFAIPGALDLLRSLRDPPDDPEIAVLAATDPANPYGAALKWPNRKEPPSAQRPQSQDFSANSAVSAVSSDRDAGRGPTRSVGATVILVNGALAAYLPRGDRQLVSFLPDAEPDRSRVGRAIASVLIERARAGGDAPRGMLIEEIDGAPPSRHPLVPFLTDAGFVAGAMGLQATFVRGR